MTHRLGLLLTAFIVCLFAACWLRIMQSDSHASMIELLEQVKIRTAAENPYLGDADLLQIDDRLAVANSPAEEMGLLWERSAIALRLGRNDEALQNLQTIEAYLPHISASLSAADLRQFEIELYFDLAVANLRKGETENCVHCRTGESCILPIQGSGVHLQRAGSTQAIVHLNNVLSRDPNHLTARWLLNVAHMTLGTYPAGIAPEFLIEPERFESEVPFPKFLNVAADTHLDTFGLAGGAIVDDFDGDGYLDVIVSDWDTSAELKYFRNNGDGSFTDRSSDAGFGGIFGGLNIRQADFDNDHDLDILVLRGGWMGLAGLDPNSLLQNDGHGVFRDVTLDVGLGDVHLPTQTADWGDFDNDGWLDLYIGNEGAPNQLFRNTGYGSFEDVADKAGVADDAVTKAVAWGDFDADGFPDLMVSNLGSNNRLFRNNKDGTFTDIAESAGVTQPVASFPVWFWDFNNDGHLDIYVSAYDLGGGMESFVADFIGETHQAEVDHLYEGDGRGGFRNVASQQGVARVTLPMGSNFGDINGDGYLDYYLGTGYTDYSALLPNRAFLNQAGKGFVDVSTASGLSHLQKGHGVSIADIDHDGDSDIFITMGGAFPGDGFGNCLFENPGFGNHWITLKLVGTETNCSAIGARIKVVIEEQGSERAIYRWIGSGSSFGGNPLRQTIGLGSAEKISEIEITWPTSQTTQTFKNPDMDQLIEITEGDANFRPLVYTSFELESVPIVPTILSVP